MPIPNYDTVIRQLRVDTLETGEFPFSVAGLIIYPAINVGTMAVVWDLLRGKQNKLKVGRGVKLVGSDLSEDEAVCGFEKYADKTFVNQLIEDRIETASEKFEESAKYKSLATFENEQIAKLEPGGDTESNPCSVRFVNEALSSKQAVLTVGGEQIAGDHATDIVASSAWVLGELRKKMSRMDVPSINNTPTKGNYGSVVSPNSVYSFVDGIVHGNGVSLGQNDEVHPNELWFSNRRIVGSDGKISSSLIVGFKALEDRVNALVDKYKVVADMRTIVIPSLWHVDVPIKNGSCLTVTVTERSKPMLSFAGEGPLIATMTIVTSDVGGTWASTPDIGTFCIEAPMNNLFSSDTSTFGEMEAHSQYQFEFTKLDNGKIFVKREKLVAVTQDATGSAKTAYHDITGN